MLHDLADGYQVLKERTASIFWVVLRSSEAVTIICNIFTLKTKATCSYEMAAIAYQTRFNSSEDHYDNREGLENDRRNYFFKAM